ncbi:MAG: hypothetical protein ACPGVH_04120 [Chitinophagales bacterium]
MKNQILLSLSTLVLAVVMFSSCKKAFCNTCTLDHSPSIRVEVCQGTATTYDGNKIILEEDISGFPKSIYTSSLELAGYKCK